MDLRKLTQIEFDRNAKLDFASGAVLMHQRPHSKNPYVPLEKSSPKSEAQIIVVITVIVVILFVIVVPVVIVVVTIIKVLTVATDSELHRSCPASSCRSPRMMIRR